MSATAAQRVKDIVEELSDIRLADLGNAAQAQNQLRELDASLAEVRGWADLVGGLLSHVPVPPRKNGRPGKRVAARPRTIKVTKASKGARTSKGSNGNGRRTGRRGPGEFAATPFVLNSVQQAGAKGIRPSEIVGQVTKAAPGKHVRPSALVSTILSRLHARGAVRKRTGRWYAK